MTRLCARCGETPLSADLLVCGSCLSLRETKAEITAAANAFPDYKDQRRFLIARCGWAGWSCRVPRSQVA